MNDATRAQITAALPNTSTWLEANAGSGKTRVLTNRVARLLLNGVSPEKILCLTYTKAAAMEMQNRLFEQLGQWAMLADCDLTKELAGLGVDHADLGAEILPQARRLFAHAIDTPGGLKIQTIHSFCASVLRRFPLEAGIPPGFSEMDDRTSTRLIGDLVNDLADHPQGRDALDAIAPYLNDDVGLVKLAGEIAKQAAGFSPHQTWGDICTWFGLDPDITEDAIIARVFLGGETALAHRIAAHLDPNNKYQRTPQRVFNALDDGPKTLNDLTILEGVLLTGEGAKNPFTAKIGSFANADVRKALGPDLDALEDWMRRVEDTRALRQTYMTARKTAALHGFAHVFLPAYAQAKQMRGWLDFDDLITYMRDLLTTKQAASWVLFRLDGGIDHILVDEAQDTSPTQWDIIAQLAEDFAAGDGARTNVARTLFVVGDKKQSIYSFQGADPQGFDRMRHHFETRLGQIGAPFQDCALLHSFRSAPAILDLVDHVAQGPAKRGIGDAVNHFAFFDDKAGRVDLWPVITHVPDPKAPDWQDPRDVPAEDSHITRLARAIAARIKRMLAQGEPIETKKNRRAITPGDILILLRRRSPLFHTIISELKSSGLPVAGVDRAQIDQPLAVKDLIALLKFLATPEDDLSLATILKSPLFGWDEAMLFDLAHGRDGILWRALQNRADTWPQTVDILKDMRDQVDFLRPYDLLERMLIRHDGRPNLVARLGPEATDGIDALLAQALVYEQSETPSLVGFVTWLEAGDVTVKRNLGQAHGEIRVMTVHGSKGLEAPVVILPDTGEWRAPPGGTKIITPQNGPILWAELKDNTAALATKAHDAITQSIAAERDRLLYVAMTRAENWLIVAAAGNTGKTVDGSWYNMVAEAMTQVPTTQSPLPELDNGACATRYQTGDWGALPPAQNRPHKDADMPGATTPLPIWATASAKRPPKDQIALSPSNLGGAKTLPSETEGDADALWRGRVVHLLEHLPHFPEPSWPAMAAEIAALDGDMRPDGDLSPLLHEATAILTNPALASLFDGDTLAEVELTGHSQTLNTPMFGIIDRLIITDTDVTAVDFKTNRAVPATPDQTPEGLLRQMGAYGEMLAPLYPGRNIKTAILWSYTGYLMHLPHDLVRAALQRATMP